MHKKLFPWEGSWRHVAGDAVLFKNKEIKPSIEPGSLPEEVGEVIQWCLFVSSLCCY